MVCPTFNVTMPWQHWLHESLNNRQQAWRAELAFMQEAVTDWGQAVQDPSWENWFAWCQARGQSGQTLFTQWCQSWAGQQLAQQAWWWESVNQRSQQWQTCAQRVLPWWQVWCVPLAQQPALPVVPVVPSSTTAATVAPSTVMPASVAAVVEVSHSPVHVVTTPEPAVLAAQVQAVVEALAEQSTTNQPAIAAPTAPKPARKRTPRPSTSRSTRRR